MSNGNDAKITNAQRNMRKTITLGQPERRGEKREKKTALLPTARRLVIGLGGIMYE